MAVSGILLLDKESDWTSQDCVSKLRGSLGERRIGHAAKTQVENARSIERPFGLLTFVHGMQTHDMRREQHIILLQPLEQRSERRERVNIRINEHHTLVSLPKQVLKTCRLDSSTELGQVVLESHVRPFRLFIIQRMAGHVNVAV